MDGFNSFPCLELLGKKKKRLRQKKEQRDLTGIDTEENDIFTEVSKHANSL